MSRRMTPQRLVVGLEDDPAGAVGDGLFEHVEEPPYVEVAPFRPRRRAYGRPRRGCPRAGRDRMQLTPSRVQLSLFLVGEQVGDVERAAKARWPGLSRHRACRRAGLDSGDVARRWHVNESAGDRVEHRQPGEVDSCEALIRLARARSSLRRAVGLIGGFTAAAASRRACGWWHRVVSTVAIVRSGRRLQRYRGSPPCP